LNQIVIQDSSVLIDLFNGHLLDDYLHLKFETVTTDFVVEEIRKESPHIAVWLKKHAKITKYDADDLAQLLARKQAESSGLSLPDVSVLYLAKDMNARLLTNDGRLRKSARRLNVEFSGVFMIMDSLFNNRITSGDNLGKALRLMLVKNAWLPAEECNKRFVKWGRAG